MKGKGWFQEYWEGAGDGGWGMGWMPEFMCGDWMDDGWVEMERWR